MTPQEIKDLRELEKWNRGFYPTQQTLKKAWGALPDLLDAAEQYNGTTLRSAIKFVEIAEAHMETARVLADENAELQKRNDVLDKALLRREKNAINAIVHEATQNRQIRQLQQEIAAKDAEISELKIDLAENARQVDQAVEEMNIEHDCEKGSWMGLAADKEEEIATLTDRVSAVEEENIGLRKEITCVNRQTYDSGRTLLGLENYQLRTNLAAKDKEIEVLDWQLNDERADGDDWETDFNEERRQKEAAQEREKRLLEALKQIDYALDHPDMLSVAKSSVRGLLQTLKEA